MYHQIPPWNILPSKVNRIGNGYLDNVGEKNVSWWHLAWRIKRTFLRFRFRSDFDSSSDDWSIFLDFISTLRIVVASFFNISEVSLSICSLSSLDSLLLDLFESLRSFCASRSLCLDRDLLLLFGLLDLDRSRSRSLSRRLLYINLIIIYILWFTLIRNLLMNFVVDHFFVFVSLCLNHPNL